MLLGVRDAMAAGPLTIVAAISVGAAFSGVVVAVRRGREGAFTVSYVYVPTEEIAI